MFAVDTPSAIITAIGTVVLALGSFFGGLALFMRRQNGKVDEARSIATQAHTGSQDALARVEWVTDAFFDERRERQRLEEELAQCRAEHQRKRRIEGRGGTGRSSG